MRLSDFEIQTNIGRGAYGEVLIAISKNTQRRYAIKIMHKQFIKAKGRSLSIFREKTILKHMSHDNIIRLEGSFTTDDSLVLVLELVEGDDLSELVEEYGRLDPSLVQDIVRQLVSCIQYLYDMGLYHGDIKPHNRLH
jgi:calcium/calmodulin-dependent protein kinase I